MNDPFASHVAAPARTGEHRLEDGRRLAWAEWGPDGAPVLLLCAGAATSRRLGFAPAAVLERLGVRLVSIDRPGVGSSDAHPSRSPADWPQDVLELRDGRQLQLLGAVGFSQGAPFALACGHAGLVPAVAFVSGTDELAHPALRARLAPEARWMVDLAARDPHQAEAAFAGIGDADTMLELVQRTSAAPDRTVFDGAAFAGAYAQALQEGFANGSAGNARDVLLTSSPWPFRAEDITARVDLWFGALDTSPVHSPDHGLTLSRRLPYARRHVFPLDGSAVLWTRAEHICRKLLDRHRQPVAVGAAAPLDRSTP